MSTPHDDAAEPQDYDGPDSDIASGNITDADFAAPPTRSDDEEPSDRDAD